MARKKLTGEGSITLDPIVEVQSPSGRDTIWDNNSGGGINSRDARINRWTLPETGVYTIEASGRGNSVGDYSLTLKISGKSSG